MSEDGGNLERVDQVGLARKPLLPLVNLRREDVRPLQELEIDTRVVLERAVGDVVEAKQADEIPLLDQEVELLLRRVTRPCGSGNAASATEIPLRRLQAVCAVASG